LSIKQNFENFQEIFLYNLSSLYEEQNMKSFLNWAGDNKRELPLYKQDENTKRAGIAHWAYPDAYVRQQYPDLYFTPHAADAVQKMGNHKPNRKADSGGTAAN
jgi:hypothetical protein